MRHTVLGELTADLQFPDDLKGGISRHDSMINLSISPDGVDKELTIDLASKIVERIDHFESLALACATAEFLEIYNENWRHYSVSDGDSGTVDVTDPCLDAVEFADRLQLTGITVCSDSVCELWFSDGGLFAGHSIFVSSFGGVNFDELSATMFG